MRLWHKQLLPYLPQKQLCSQWRECCCIARNIAVNGTPNHILVNKIMNYPLTHFIKYSQMVVDEMERRGYCCNVDKFGHWMACDVDDLPGEDELFHGWHNYRYAVQCYFNLQEKSDCGGFNRDEWWAFIDGFNAIDWNEEEDEQ